MLHDAVVLLLLVLYCCYCVCSSQSCLNAIGDQRFWARASRALLGTRACCDRYRGTRHLFALQKGKCFCRTGASTGDLAKSGIKGRLVGGMLFLFVFRNTVYVMGCCVYLDHGIDNRIALSNFLHKPFSGEVIGSRGEGVLDIMHGRVVVWP